MCELVSSSTYLDYTITYDCINLHTKLKVSIIATDKNVIKFGRKANLLTYCHTSIELHVSSYICYRAANILSNTVSPSLW